MIFACPQCRAELELPDGTQGRKAGCPSCGEVIVVAGACQQPDAAPPNSEEPTSGEGGERIGDGETNPLETSAKTAASRAGQWMQYAFLAFLINVVASYLVMCLSFFFVQLTGAPVNRPDSATINFVVFIHLLTFGVLVLALMAVRAAGNHLQSLEARAPIIFGIIACFLLAMACIFSAGFNATQLVHRGAFVNDLNVVPMIEMILSLVTLATCLPAAILAIAALNHKDVSDHFMAQSKQEVTSPDGR